jgi:Rod binding domain-containing protein
MKPVEAATVALQKADTALQPPPAKPSEKALKAARDFEGIMVRHMLESMQKTTEINGKSHENSGYQSMATEALANSIVSGGGLGLADLIAHTLESEMSRGKPR